MSRQLDSQTKLGMDSLASGDTFSKWLNSSGPRFSHSKSGENYVTGSLGENELVNMYLIHPSFLEFHLVMQILATLWMASEHLSCISSASVLLLPLLR